MAKDARRSWIERLGPRGDHLDPQDWVVVATGSQETEPISNYAERTGELLTDAGIEAKVDPYVVPDGQTLSGITGNDGPSSRARLRVAVRARRTDQARAEEILQRRPKAQPVSNDELTRLALEAKPHSDV